MKKNWLLFFSMLFVLLGCETKEPNEVTKVGLITDLARYR